MTPPGALERAHADRLLAILPETPAPAVDRAPGELVHAADTAQDLDALTVPADPADPALVVRCQELHQPHARLPLPVAVS